MSDPIQNRYIRAEGETFDAEFFHYGGRFTYSLNRKYVDGKVAFVDMIDISQLDLDDQQARQPSDENESEDGEGAAEDIVDEEHIINEV
ncbi:hypothetical protein Tco_0536347 [Tanacetum coccineum]